MVGQTALHGVEAVVIAGLGLGQPSTVGTVHHLHQGPVTSLRGGNLRIEINGQLLIGFEIFLHFSVNYKN